MRDRLTRAQSPAKAVAAPAPRGPRRSGLPPGEGGPHARHAVHEALHRHGGGEGGPHVRGAHSSTFQLNVRAFWYMGAHLGGVYGVLGGISGHLGCIVCQKRLRLSSEVDGCKPLPHVGAVRALVRAVHARHQHVRLLAQYVAAQVELESKS
jgi:hypothetical protein